jgi:SM-20-related protein
MPSVGFFRATGLFVISDFLDPKFIADLSREMVVAPREKGLVVKAGGVDCLDENIRKVDATHLPREIRAPLKQRLLQILPDLEKHFQVSLGGCESPQYLVYRPGDFFKPHADGGHAMGNSQDTRRRRVSAVIFLNGESPEPAEGSFGDGHLTFYGLLDGPQWEKCGMALTAKPGLLIAFPSDKVHEVTPVTHGLRFTVVTWFYAPDEESPDQKADIELEKNVPAEPTASGPSL